MRDALDRWLNRPPPFFGDDPLDVEPELNKDVRREFNQTNIPTDSLQSINSIKDCPFCP
jgi:hypothetical protein